MRTFKRMLSLVLVCVMAMAMLAFPANAASITEGITGGVSGSLIYSNSGEYKNSSYGRVVEMANGDLLATWCKVFPPVTGNWEQGNNHFDFYKSSDNGETWTKVTTLDVSAYGNQQGMPGLFVLPQKCGNFPAGTILFATNDWNLENDYGIHVWRSTDNGKTWVKHGDLAKRPESLKQEKYPGSVWEPEFAVSSDGRLICYYSDEMQKGYDQCLALEISSDGGLTWGGYKIIVGTYHEEFIRGVTDYQWRPGMPRVTRMSNGTYIMAYENIHGGHIGQISVIFSEDGINWGDPTKRGAYVMLGDENDKFPGPGAFQCPTIACIDDGSTYGRLFLRGMNDSCPRGQCFTSTDGGKTWNTIDAPLSAVRDETKGSSWSGTFLAKGNMLIEVNNVYNGSYNEIRCGRGVLIDRRMFIDGADYVFYNAPTGYCLDDAGGSMEWGNEMIVWHENMLDTQSWRLEHIHDEYFTLVCEFSNLALDNPCGSDKVGERMVQWDVNKSPAQRWKFIPAENEYFFIQNEDSGLYLDVEGDYTVAGAKVIQNSFANSGTQRWFVGRIYKSDIYRLRSSNIFDCHVYVNKDNNKAMIANKGGAPSMTASEWRIVPGLADSSCISFESVKHPGYYLRHCDGVLMISQYSNNDLFKKDATWRLRDALDGSSGVSFESFNITGCYIRHCNSYLRIDPIRTDLDRRDASFYLEMQ